jgi:hypothetical protein
MQRGNPATWRWKMQGSDAWDTNTPEAWCEEVGALGWKPVTFDDGRIWYWRLEGKCPRCKPHLLWQEVGPGFGEGLTTLSAKDADASHEKVWVSCNCSDTHGRAAGSSGCGQAGFVRGPRPRDADAAFKEGI